MGGDCAFFFSEKLCCFVKIVLLKCSKIKQCCLPKIVLLELDCA